MAIYSLSVSTIGRASGRSAVAAAAYRAGATLDDDRQGLRHDYSRKRGVLHSEITTPDVVPVWAGDRERLWNEVDTAEDKSTRRDTAKTAREFRVALPCELDAAARIEATRAFARYLVETYGTAVDWSIHAPDGRGDERNFHAHMMMTTRTLDAEGFGKKVRDLDSPKTSGAHMEAIREAWAGIANAALEKAGCAERIDHRSFADQGIDREATVHLGVAASGMERKGGETDLGNLNREIEARNGERDAMRAELADVSAEIVDLAEERAKRAAEKEITASVRTHDPARVLDAITERRATFTRSDLNYHLAKQITDAKDRSAFMGEVLAHGETVALRDEEGGPVTRYTTRGVLQAEAQIAEAGRGLAQQKTHGIRADRLADCLDRHSELDHEQRAAVAHCTEAGGLAIVAGEAGSGKSRTIGAVRDAYEAEGKRVIGLAWTNAVAQDMGAAGFDESSTIAAELMRQKSGRGTWDSDTVLMIDEAGMLATRHLSEVMTRAQAAGAKVILAGDEKQLASIEHGGMFGALREEHGGAELHSVRRVREADQRQAFNQMHRGDFRGALDVFEARGAIHWQAGEDAARAALVARYMADTAADPDKTRFAFAYTNAEVATVNAAIRERRKERGELGADQILSTKDGPMAFATGDRVQFTGSAYGRAAKAEGLVNGMVGTVIGLEDGEMTVRLDSADKDGTAREVSFVVGEDAQAGEFNAIRHGYAGTIYKGQGRTLDQTYVLHSRQWRSATSYVALTRHREDVALFVDKDEARDLDRLARQMARIEEKRAASQFHKDEQTPEQRRSPASRRYGDLHAAHEALKAKRMSPANQNPSEGQETPTGSGGAWQSPSGPSAPARPLTAREQQAARLAAYQSERAVKAAPVSPENKAPNEPETGRDFYTRQKPPDRGRSR